MVGRKRGKEWEKGKVEGKKGKREECRNDENGSNIRENIPKYRTYRTKLNTNEGCTDKLEKYHLVAYYFTRKVSHTIFCYQEAKKKPWAKIRSAENVSPACHNYEENSP